MPVISNLVYTVTDTTIVATWTTDVASDSNLSAGGKAAIDNGIAAASTSHQAIVTGLKPGAIYSCFVTSGGTSSSPQNQTTNASPTRVLATSATNGAVTVGGGNQGDTYHNFLSSDGNTYILQDDGYGFVSGTPNAGYATQAAQLTNETTMTGGSSLLTTYGAFAESDGTDGPSGGPMSNKSSGIFGLNGNLHAFVYRQDGSVSSRYCNIIKSTNHGSTWNNFTATSTFVSGGNPVTPHSPSEPIQFYANTIGLVFPIRYAADDGTLGYTTAGNQIDGGNAYVYCVFTDLDNTIGPALMRIPRITFDLQTLAGIQYWVGPVNPTPLQFTSDSNWSSSPTGATTIWTGSSQVPNPTVGNSFPYGSDWVDITFVPGLNSYVLTQTTYGNGQFQFYSAPTPAGPWSLFYTQTNSASGKQWYGPFLFHRDVAGNSATSNIPLRFLYSGNSGGSSYDLNYSTLTLNPTSGGSMIQLVSYGFTTVENPLSDGGNFSTCPSCSALKVTSSGVCEATTVSPANCVMYWSGAIPVGDTGGTWPADQYSEITVGNLVSGDSEYCAVRCQGGGETFYLLVVAGNTASPTSLLFTLYAFVSGTAHSLTTFSVSVHTADVIRLSVTGNVLTTTQNGTTVNTFTDTNNYVTSGAPGLGITAATITSDSITLWAAGANQAASPTFSPVAGTYTGTQTVTINGPASSTIYYTTNGSTPTRSSSSFATGGTVSVSTSETLKAISSVSDFADSSIGSASYTINPSSAPNSVETSGAFGFLTPLISQLVRQI